MTPHNSIVFFDGVCNLCNHSVSFLIKADRKKKLKYSPLQGDFAKENLTGKSIDTSKSIVFLRNKNIYIKSEAVVQILIQVGGFYKLIGKILSIFPYAFLNIFYTFIAKNRYRFFGQRETCRVPTPEETELFID